MRPSTLQLSASLCEALRGEETEMVEVLLKRGADPNLVLPEGIAAIHLAAGMEQESGVRCLGLILQFGGDPNVRSVDDLTPLHVAASWGCYTCLKLLLMEGGDPSLEDQDGNRAIDLAVEHGNEMCVRILQQVPRDSRQEQSPWMTHRRTESFLSTDNEHFSAIGSWLSEDESPPSRLNRTMKESFEDVGPGSSVHHLVAAAPTGHPRNCVPEDEACGFADHPSTSWLTEDSQQHGAFHHHCTPHARPVASSSTLLSCSDIPGNQALSAIRVPEDKSPCPKSEEPVGTPQAPCFKNTTDEGWRSSLDPTAFQGGVSPDSQSGTPKSSPEVLSTTGSWRSCQAPPICAIRDGCEAGVLETQGADATLTLSQYKSFLDPDLMVKITGQEGLDVTSPDHAYLFCQLDSTATLDLEKTVVNQAFLTRAYGEPDGCQEEGESFNESSGDGSSSSQFASCNTEFYPSYSEAPSCYKVQKSEERKAGLVSSPFSLGKVQRNRLLSRVSQDPRTGASKCCSGQHRDTPSGPAAGRDAASPTKSEDRKHLCDGSHFREAFPKICAGKRSLDLQNTGQSECLGNIREPGLSRMSQGDLLVKDPTENWDFSTLLVRESQGLTVPDDPGEEDTALLEALASVTGKQDTIAKKQKGSNGATSAEARVELNEDQGRRPMSDLSRSTGDVAERGGDSWAKDTILIQRESEETQPLPVGESSVTPADDTVAVPHHTLNVGGEETPDLDTRLRMMMLATKAHPSPLLQPDQRPCHVTPCSKSRTTASANHTGNSASLFDETLETPRRPRRVRSPNGMPPMASEARKQDEGLSSGSSPCWVEEETSSLEDTELITGSPRSCSQASWQPSRPSGPTVLSLGAPKNSGRKICIKDTRSSRESDVALGVDCGASLKVKPLFMESTWLPREEEGTAQEGVDAVTSCVELGKSCKKPSSSQSLPNRSRVSFSRLSSRGPLAMPGRISPLPERLSPSLDSCNPDVLLSPGGRPVNLSASEPVEYLYVDETEGHALVERHVPSTDHSVANTTSSEDTIIYDWRAYTKSQAAGQSDKENSPPWALQELGHFSDEALVRKLRDFGVNPGPVTGLTRKVYVQLLEKLMSDPKSKARKSCAGYSPELSSALETYQIPYGKDDEMTLSRQFDQPDKNRKWREGVIKSSFNYLLLDPRVTQNLPFRSQYVSQAECFRTFISAIFYVGKGTRSRPYCHLYEALTHHKESQRKRGTKACPKVQHILEIWASGEGVISMHCFQNVIPVEAYTREASMVDAVGLKMLTNQKRGNYYGVVEGWPMKRRRHLGVYLLHRAMQIFLAEGERQLRPTDIRTGQ